jgi:hypothetical protein
MMCPEEDRIEKGEKEKEEEEEREGGEIESYTRDYPNNDICRRTNPSTSYSMTSPCPSQRKSMPK